MTGVFPCKGCTIKQSSGTGKGAFSPDPASGEITETGIIAGIPEYDGIIVSRPFSPLVPGVDQQAADPPVLPDWKNGQRCQRQLHRIACPDFGKKNMSRDLAVHFGDQRQFFDDGTAFSQPPDKIRFVAIGMFRASESLTDDIKDRPVIDRSFLTDNDLFCRRLFHSSSMAQSARFTNYR